MNFPRVLAFGTLLLFGLFKLVAFSIRGPTMPAPWASAMASPGVMQALISLAVLGAALFIILSKKYPSESDKWAYGTVGTILGYWLSP